MEYLHINGETQEKALSHMNTIMLVTRRRSQINLVPIGGNLAPPTTETRLTKAFDSLFRW